MFFSKKQLNREIDPDEIFLDSSNLPEFNRYHFEGRIERPLSVYPFWGLGIFFLFLLLIFGWKMYELQIIRGAAFTDASSRNRLEQTIVWNKRGVIFDRNGIQLVENISNAQPDDFSLRSYATISGIAHVLGYIKYPAKDKAGNFYQTEFESKGGVEQFYNQILGGFPGVKIVETDVFGEIQSESVARKPLDGEDLTLSIDSRIEEKLFTLIKELAGNVGFTGGAGVLIDVHNGEILALASFPEYDSNVLTKGEDRSRIKTLTEDERTPFLNRAVSGLYTPGSIVKPFVAIAALNEGIITPEDTILSTGSISIPHPYIQGEESVFKDWKAHGWVDMRQALAHSSNVYFYEVGGGYKEQKGLGIGRIEQYMRLFGFGKETGIDMYGEESGIIPTPEWKEEVFNDEWRVGDTYNTAIGQYGFQITPLQAARAIAAIANDGTLLTPHLLTEKEAKKISTLKDAIIKIPREHFTVVKEGLRQSVLEGTAAALNLPAVSVAAKTGTAEVGILKKNVNSWVIGFFPYEKPRFAFAVVMERGDSHNLIGAPYVMRQLLEWMAGETPEYLQ
ncbi:MAG: penicillin-binding transpeptidase domain-containing protein [bacterium]|nr:penicillin-binding transpeptidase domain-containing protein [bacterium]